MTRSWFFVVLSLTLAWPALSPAATVWVAKDGADTAAGTKLHPFATLERARAELRAKRKAGEAGEVVLRGGTYELTAPLSLNTQDSGTAAAPITWRAATGEEVRLSAGRAVPTWQSVSDPAILSQLDPAVRASVIVADLKAQGITDFGEMSGGFGKTGSTGLELFVNDQPMNLSRYPQDGYMTIAEALGPTPTAGTRPDDRLGRKEGLLRVSDSRVARWVHEKNPQVFGYWYWDWADDRQGIASIDPATLTLTLKKPWHQFGYRTGQYFYAYNLLCEINRPRDWVLDRDQGRIYLLTANGKKPGRAMVSLLPSVVTLDGASHVIFRDLILEGARGNAVTMTNCEGSGLNNVTIRNCGSWAATVEGGHDCYVRNSQAYNLGDGGVSLNGGDRTTLAAGRHEVSNCTIHDYSRWDRTYQPAIRLDGVGCRALRNLIYRAPHQAIGFQGNDHLIAYNEIHHVCESSNDAGAIYAWNDWAGRGNRILYNYLHDIQGYLGQGACGVYLDDNFSSALIEGNVFAAVATPIQLGGGRDHRVLNNLFVRCASGIHIDARGLDWRAYGYAELKEKLERWPYQVPPWSRRYPELTGILGDNPMAPKGVFLLRNVMVATGANEIDGKALPFVTLKDNLFRASGAILFRPPGRIPSVNPGSPQAEAIHFEAIPTGKIGPVTR